MFVEDKMNLSFLVIESQECKAYQIQQDTNKLFVQVMRAVMVRDFFIWP